MSPIIDYWIYLALKYLSYHLIYSSSMSQDLKYQPFKYPPDMELARLHSQCSEPGDQNTNGLICPCCNVQEKTLVHDWARRNISSDFKQNGAIKSYFSLLKFYCFTILVAIGIYSIYQMVCLQYICSHTEKEDNNCLQVFGVWMISNMDLAEVMRQKGEEDMLTVLLILRSITFLFLIFSNMISLIVASRNNNVIIDISSYALFFKNIDRSWGEAEMRKAIADIDPTIEIRDILFFRKTSTFTNWYYTKINTYFALKDDEMKPKVRAKQEKLLIKSAEMAEKTASNVDQVTTRAVVVFSSLYDRAQVYKKYSVSMFGQIAIKVGATKQRMFVTTAPLLEDAIWENLGEQSRQKTRMKVITFLLMLVILGISYVVLHFGMVMADKDDKKSINIKEKSWSTFIALLVVALALVFRAFMNKLADMRKSSTKTARTLFIVSTTVIYHFIYFLILPTFYFVTAKQDRSKKLFSISYQALNFLIVQLLIAGFDLFYCCWDRGRTKIFAKGKKGLCQKQLNKVLTSPRFALEFKLIILFKSWSFVTFYGFQVPYILVLLFLVLVFIYVMDKRHIYTHYRVQLIESKVQYNFLKIYSNFFTIFMCIVFLLTQNLTYEIYIAISLSLVAIVFQILYSSKKPEITLENNLSLDEFGPTETYRSKYEAFLETLDEPEIDKQIDDYIHTLKQGISLHDISSDKQVQQKLVQ